MDLVSVRPALVGVNRGAEAPALLPRLFERLTELHGTYSARSVASGPAEACLEIRDFEERIRAVEKQLKLLAEQMPVVKQLLTIPGIGLVTATALVALDLVPHTWL